MWINLDLWGGYTDLMTTWKRKKKLEKEMMGNKPWWEMLADVMRATGYAEEKEKTVFKLQKRPRSYSSSVERPKPDSAKAEHSDENPH